MSAALPTDNEDDIALTGIDIVVLKDKELINTILLKSGSLDDCANRPN